MTHYANLLHVVPSAQQLLLYRGGNLTRSYRIATSRYGLGEQSNSYKTPCGWHVIRAKIGARCALNAVFVSRRPTGEIYSAELAQQYPSRDWILSRILWLSGLEKGKNRLGEVDTMRRYIYIHGTPDDQLLSGEPSSHGCIRMSSLDIIELFGLVDIGNKIFIGENLSAEK